MQATEAIKIILGSGNTLSGRLLLYDAMAMRFHEVRLKPRADAPAITSLCDYQGFCGVAKTAPASSLLPSEPFARLSVAEAARRMREEGWAPFVLDVRTRNEADIVSLSCVSLQQPHRRVTLALDQIPERGDVLVHCKSGVRSAAACHALSAAGRTNLINLDGGILAWAKEIDPSLPVY